MFDSEESIDSDIPDLVRDLVEDLRPKKPKNCDTCAYAHRLCSSCVCPDRRFGSKCDRIDFFEFPDGGPATVWREDGRVGDCPVWEE